MSITLYHTINQMKPSRTILLIFLSVICVMNSGHVWSQDTKYNINGALKDSTDIVPYASIILLDNADSTMVKATYSDDFGSFKFNNIKEGNYLIKASSIGLEDLYHGPFVLTEDLNLGVLKMKSDSASLDAFTLTAKKPLIQVLPDRTVFNVQGTLNATGTNAFDLLRKAPGVTIDNSDNIILEGKTGVQIHIDGKPTLLAGENLVNYLRSIQSSDVESIEIISQPSARYDAAGNAGIIDIILKKDKTLGLNGSANLSHRYGRNHMTVGGFSLNYRRKKFNVYGTFNATRGDTWNFIYMDRHQEGSRYDSESETINQNTSGNMRFGADFMPKRFHTFGVLFNGSINSNNVDGETVTDITPAGSNQVEQQLLANNISERDNNMTTANFNYRFKDTSGHEFYFDIDYGIYDNRNSTTQPNSYVDVITGVELFENNYRMVTPSNIDIFTVKFDYSQNLFDGKVSIGAKYSNVETSNTFDFYNVYATYDSLDENRSNQFNYSENINAGYINYARQINKRLNIQLGVRAEQTNSRGILTSLQSTSNDDVKRQYLNWFPSGGLSYRPSMKHMWSFNFSRRIQRPNYESLNPFEYQTDELSFVKGNPFLQPQYTNSVKISHTYRFKVTSSIGYSYVSDFFAQITDTLGTNKNFLTPRNVADQETYNFSIGSPFSIKDWWNVYVSINGSYTKYTGNDDKFQAIEIPALNFYGQSSFSLGKGVTFEISGWFNSPSIWGGTYLTRSIGALNLALQKKWLDDDLSFRVSFNDILFTNPWRANMQYGALDINGTGGWESRHVIAYLSYAFGRKEIKAARDRKTGLEEENDRVGN